MTNNISIENLSFLENLLLEPVAGEQRSLVPLGTVPFDSQRCRIEQLIEAFRIFGHLEAAMYPKEIKASEGSSSLQQAIAVFAKEEYNFLFPSCGLDTAPQLPLRAIIERLRKTYCSRVGIEYKYFCSPEIAASIERMFEHTQSTPSFSKEEKQTILNLLNRAEVLETFLHTKFVGHKRFSIEGAETIIPMVWAGIEDAASLGIQEVVLGMTHRGRINILANVLQKSFDEIFAEFEGGQIDAERSGDVKYHKGFSSLLTTQQGTVCLTMPPNPSHLESVGPVIEGIVRAKQATEQAIAFVLHGDAALAGQGVVYETLQMAGLQSYTTGGTIHLVINNHIGFTTLPEDGRSTRYCTDIAKAFGMPVFHVNAEDPEMCVWVMKQAIRLRQQFGCDVWIDCNCWRKWGHNETDEPAYTQPVLYKKIRAKASIRNQYYDQLMHSGTIEKQYVEQLEHEFKTLLQDSLEAFRNKEMPMQKMADTTQDVIKPSFPSYGELEKAIHIVTSIPQGYELHPRLYKMFEERSSNLAKQGKDFLVDWGLAETLAFATLLEKGLSVRLVGQDSRRGTFSHRHGMLVCQKTDRRYFPLQSFAKNAQFELHDSLLSEFAALGFEYGFSIAAKDYLVIWEAQFGDFTNGAQVIIDQYIASAEAKWQLESPLTLFLPHGYEGQGPEHSSARIERFLSLAAEGNIRIAMPSTTVQLFCLLRRQAYSEKKPLILFTPKGLLRFHPSFSSLDAFAHSEFTPVIDTSTDPQQVRTIAFCSGRIYYELIEAKKTAADQTVALVRIEELYPFPQELVEVICARYTHMQKMYWVQEEPENMGVWFFIKNQLAHLPLEYIGRPPSASPACGSEVLHKQQQRAIIEALFSKDML